MKKIIYILALIFLTSTNFVYADATSTSTSTATATSTLDIDTGTSTDSQTSSTADVIPATSTSDVSSDLKKVKVYIKNGSDLIFEGDVEINNEDIGIIDSGSTVHQIKNNNALAVLNSADMESDSFNVSELLYYLSFNSFFLNCIETESENLCYNWKYVVNGEYPSSSIDDYVLSKGDEIYFYFGQSKRIVTPDETVIDTQFAVTSEEYSYIDDTWTNLSGNIVGIFKDDPENSQSQIVLATSTIDEEGKSYFTIETEGNYKIGFEEDYYYPSYDLTIAPTSTATTTDLGNNSSGGGKGSSSSNTFDIDEAIDFLLGVQENNGGFGADLYSDWASVAFSSVNESNSLLKSYVKDSSVNSDLYEKLRKTIALLSLDLDPQEDYEENLIQEILNKFDGEQFGEKVFFNDDIFALIVLQKLGLDEGDEEISKTIDFVLSKQSSSGAFQGVDITAAVIQALVEFDDYPGVSSALTYAENYLRVQQNSNGSWGDVYATSWSVMAMTALGYDSDDWQGNPLEYLGDKQDSDGGLLIDDLEGNRIWSTSYAIAAASEKTWIEIMDSFSLVEDSEVVNINNYSKVSSSNDSENETKNKEQSKDENEVLDETTQNITAAELITENLDKILLYLEKNDLSNSQIDLSSGPNEFKPDEIDFIEVKTEIENYLEKEKDVSTKEIVNKQTAAVINSMDFQRFIYLILAIVALIISVIMFKRK